MAWLGASVVRGEQDLWGLLFDGDLRFKRSVDGVWGPLLGPFNNTRFALIPQEGESVNRTSRMRGSSGSNLSTIRRAVPTQFGMAFDDAGQSAFELALRGSSSALAQVAGTATSEVIAIDQLGGWYALANKKLDAAPTFTGTGGTPALVVGDGATDDIRTEIDLESGYFFVNAAAANITADDNIEATYDYGDLAGYQMEGDQIGQSVIYAEFVGVAEGEGIGMRITIRSANVSATGELNTIGDEFPTFDFQGEMSTPSGQAGPYRLEWWNL